MWRINKILNPEFIGEQGIVLKLQLMAISVIFMDLYCNLSLPLILSCAIDELKLTFLVQKILLLPLVKIEGRF